MNEQKDEIVGVSFLVDQNTKNYLNNIKFTKDELQNLYSLMNNYSEDLEILKIIQLSNISTDEVPNYDCAIISVNNNLKALIDIKNKTSYLLTDKKQKNYILFGTYYLIKFIPKHMISSRNVRKSSSRSIKNKIKK